ncbi:MAG: hypothetical protein ABJA89_13200 [Lapillicoccus sp.]
MGLSHRMATLAVDATHVLVVEAPGAWRTRVAIEREIGRRGWRLASSAADADAIVVAGTPGPALSQRVEAVWQQLPGPRSRTVLADHTAPVAVPAALDAVAAELLDAEAQSHDACDRPSFDPKSLDEGDAGGDESHMEGDDDMDMGDMDMVMAPSGIPLAEGGDDRDGLGMDVLHLPLGPVLPYWPAGVVLHATLQGDLLVAAAANVLDADVPDSEHHTSVRLHAAERAALRCDQLADLLALAGWADGQSSAVRVRDTLIDDPDGPDGSRLLDGLERRVRRARLLRWSLRGIGDLRRIDDPRTTSSAPGGDVYDRLLKLLDDARSDLAGTDRTALPLPELLAVAERLVVGLDLATARLVVASLAIDTSSQPVHAGHDPEGVHGA